MGSYGKKTKLDYCGTFTFWAGIAQVTSTLVRTTEQIPRSILLCCGQDIKNLISIISSNFQQCNGSKYVFPCVCFCLSISLGSCEWNSTRSRNHNGIYAVVLRRVEVMWPIIAQRVKVPQESLFPLHLTKVYSALGLSLPRCYLNDLTWHHLPYPSVLDF